jgi:hypothetical protein
LFCVSVPVLSEQSMFMPAVSSIAARRDTMAPSLLSSLLPIASVVVVTISIAMGIEATSSTTAKLAASLALTLRSSSRYRKTIRQSVMLPTLRMAMMYMRSFCRFK